MLPEEETVKVQLNFIKIWKIQNHQNSMKKTLINTIKNREFKIIKIIFMKKNVYSKEKRDREHELL